MNDSCYIGLLYAKDDDDLRNQLYKNLIALNYEVTTYLEYDMTEYIVTNSRRRNIKIIFDNKYGDYYRSVDELIFNIRSIFDTSEYNQIRRAYISIPDPYDGVPYHEISTLRQKHPACTQDDLNNNKNKKGADSMNRTLNIDSKHKKVVGIKYVGYKGNKTTVVFDDNSTVTVRCRDGEQFDLYPAITYAFMERNLGLSKNKTHKLIQNLIDDADARKLKKLNAMSKKMKGAKSNEKTEKSNDEG